MTCHLRLGQQPLKVQLWPSGWLTINFTAFSDLIISVVLFVLQAVAGSLPAEVSPTKVEPQVAVVCDVRNPLHPQYMDSAGRWISDLQTKNPCMKDKIDILEFCRKVKKCFWIICGCNLQLILAVPHVVKRSNRL